MGPMKSQERLKISKSFMLIAASLMESVLSKLVKKFSVLKQLCHAFTGVDIRTTEPPMLKELDSRGTIFLEEVTLIEDLTLINLI